MADNYLITGYWGVNHITPENDRGINAAMFGIGRFVLPVGERFKAEYIGNNTVRMYDGKLMDNGAAAGIPAGEYVDLLISNAGQGMNRNDLIVFQYSKDTSTLIEKGEFVVIKGEETSGAAADPELVQFGLLSNTATLDQFPLYRITVSGTEISNPVTLFNVSNPLPIRWQYTAASEAEDLEKINAILDEMGDGEAGGYAVGYAICRREYSVAQSPLHGWLYRIESLSRDFARIEATSSLSNGVTMQRVRIGSVWQPWEHLNPSLYEGQEYRTTERFDGQPVYTRLLLMTWNDLWSIQLLINNISNIIRCSGELRREGAETTLLYADPSYKIKVELDTNNTTHVTMFGEGTGALYLQLWYTRRD